MNSTYVVLVFVRIGSTFDSVSIWYIYPQATPPFDSKIQNLYGQNLCSNGGVGPGDRGLSSM